MFGGLYPDPKYYTQHISLYSFPFKQFGMYTLYIHIIYPKLFKWETKNHGIIDVQGPIFSCPLTLGQIGQGKAWLSRTPRPRLAFQQLQIR